MPVGQVAGWVPTPVAPKNTAWSRRLPTASAIRGRISAHRSKSGSASITTFSGMSAMPAISSATSWRLPQSIVVTGLRASGSPTSSPDTKSAVGRAPMTG